MAAGAYTVLERCIIAWTPIKTRRHRMDRKSMISFALYAAAIGAAFLSPWIAIAIYVANALLWFIPDRRIESVKGR